MTLSEEFTEFTVDIWESKGLDALSSKLFATLFLEPKELSIDELSKKTGYSLASVSNKMRFIENIGLASRIKKPGTKKVFYYVEKDLKKIMKKQFDTIFNKEIKPIKETMPKLIEKYENEIISKEEKEKLGIIKNYYYQTLELEKKLLDFKKRFDDK
ncbi:MAG: hypothetical protein AABW92_04250 [Nanoarchaeota archaeon]